MNVKTLLASLALAAPLALGATDALAWTGLDNSYPVWGSLPVAFKINQGSIPANITLIAVARVDQGFAEWTTAGGQGCTTFSVVNQGDTNATYNYQDGQNVIRWITSSWPQELGDPSSVIGVTLPVFFQNNDIADADIVFNDVGFDWNDSGNGSFVDTKSIATHEQGHFLGLGHTNAGGATMEPFYPGGKSQGTVAQDDIDGVCALYPIGGSAVVSSSSGGAADCSTCSEDSTYNACSGAYDACGSSQDCVDFVGCYQNCPDQACVDACVSAHPSGTQLYVDLIDCICNVCSVECAVECGGSSSSSTAASTTAVSTADSVASTAETTTGVGGGGVGGAGATAGVGGAGATVTTGSGPTKKKPKAVPQINEVSGCAIGHTDAGVGTMLLLAAGALAASRRRQRR